MIKIAEDINDINDEILTNCKWHRRDRWRDRQQKTEKLYRKIAKKTTLRDFRGTDNRWCEE